ncbi:cupin [Escherichia coli]|nr:cupin [Escherichia coli]
MNNLIKKEIIENFKKYNFQKYPFVFTDVNYKNLINWNDLNKLLEKDILHYPRVRMANDNFPEIRGYKGFIRYTYSQTGDRTPHINRHQLYKCLRDGATLIVDRCQSFFESVDESRLWLSKELECTCSANLYAAFTATPSFGLHFDNHDVIAVQIEGIKKWKVYNPTYSYPLEDERSFDYLPPNTSPDYEFDITPGQAIYLPAGYWHNVTTQSKHSLHLSFTVIRPRRLELFKTLFDELKNNPYMREPIEHGDSLSDKEKIKTIITNAINSFDIQFAENMLKAQSRTYRYKKIKLEHI